MSRCSRYLPAALCAALLTGAVSVSAQQATQPAQPRVQPAQPAVQGQRPLQPGQAVQPVQPGQPGQPGQLGQPMEARTDAQLAACLIVDNHGEVELGKFASEHSENAQVKRFAEQMVEDHGEFITKLQRFAGQLGQAPAGGRPAAQPGQPNQLQTTPAQPNQPQANQNRQPTENPANVARTNADRPGAADQPRATARAAGGQRGGALNLVALKRELGEQCLRSAKKELQSKEGHEFDMCYVGMQIAKHMEAIDAMTVFKQHGSDEFGQTLDEGIRTAQTHLDHAKQLIKQLEGTAASTARRQSDK